MTDKIIAIDVIADFVCPWCFLGRRRLQKAISFLPQLDIRVSWKPFQIAPDVPKAGKSYQDHMRTIFGSRDGVDEAERQLISLGEEDSIAFDFSNIAIMPNSLDAHRVVYWAAQDETGVQDDLVEELFSRFFEQGQNIGKHDVLVDSAKQAGMRSDVVEKLLQTQIDLDVIKQDIKGANYIGVQGVPCFIIDKKFVIMGAQSSDDLADAIQQIADGFEPGTTEDR